MTAAAAWRDGLRRVKDGPAILASGWALLTLVSFPLAAVLHDAIARHLGDSLVAQRVAAGYLAVMLIAAFAMLLPAMVWLYSIAGTLEYRTIFAVGSTLFLMTFAMNLFSQRLARKFRER